MLVFPFGSKANLLSQGQKLKAKRKLGTFKEKELQSSLRKPRALLSYRSFKARSKTRSSSKDRYRKARPREEDGRGCL